MMLHSSQKLYPRFRLKKKNNGSQKIRYYKNSNRMRKISPVFPVCSCTISQWSAVGNHSTMTEASGCPVQLNEAPTNDLVYFHGLADLGDLHQELLQYVPLFCELFPRLGADGLTYSEMDQAIDLHTGGLHVTPHVTPKLPGSTTPDTSEAVTSVHLSGYCLESKIPSFFELWSRLFRAPCWSDVQRLITLILMSASGEWSANVIADSAHHFAMRRAAANLSASSRFQELWNGLEQGLLVKRIASRLGKTGVPADATVHQLTEKMIDIWRHISVPARLKFSLHGEPDGLKVGLDYLQQFVKQLTPLPLNPSPSRRVLAFDQLRSCSYFVMPYTVHYVAKALPAPAYDSSDYASYRVLSHLLTSKFLHREIREKGGAYGGRAITRPESMLLFSYRDPNALRTVNVFENALDWAETAEFPAQDVNEAKLAVFQELDKPVSAGSRGLTNFLLGISDELRQTQRTQLFKVEAPALRSAASQLLHSKIHGGCVILGPQDSTDWPREQTDQDPAWEKIVFTE
ncbi:Eupitrilysin (M16 family) [Fasciola gigantica]|uniref:Eupitrilysin (M16 family) n=1 Tax=Fasciola gigantica TaxID=46835 RepID=A0A504Z8W2_FASGI|nr:Eupitrilysin (M16 family) [Fasciola gigantica]